MAPVKTPKKSESEGRKPKRFYHEAERTSMLIAHTDETEEHGLLLNCIEIRRTGEVGVILTPLEIEGLVTLLKEITPMPNQAAAPNQ